MRGLPTLSLRLRPSKASGGLPTREHAKRGRARGLVAWLAVAVPAAAPAAELTVCGDAPVADCYATIAEAMLVAVDGDVIRIAGGFHNEALRFTDRDLALEAVPGTTPSLLGDGTAAPVVGVVGGEVSLTGLVIGSPTGRALEISAGARVTLVDVKLSATAIQSEGGIVHASDGTLDVDRSTFSGGTALLAGGQIYAVDTDVTIRASRLVGGVSLVSGGGLYAVHTGIGSVLLEETAFVGNSALSYMGAAVLITGQDETDWSDAPITIRRCLFDGNVSGENGAVHLHYNDGEVLVEESVFSNNTSGRWSSALVWHLGSSAVYRRNVFCGNSSDAPVGQGAVAYAAEADRVDMVNNQFVDNQQTTISLDRPLAEAFVQSNHFVGNITPFRPILAAGFETYVTFTDNLVALNRSTSTALNTGQVSFEEDPVQLGHNLWWHNEPPDALEQGDHEIVADPRLDAYQPGSPCEYINEVSENEGDPLWPSWHGPARDAGSGPARDLDGTPLDIGAFGGPEARPIPDWDDDDGDGVPTLFDCNRYDDEVASGLPDPPYDGVDADCRGDDDFDADDDGFRPATYALPGAPIDCDDRNARRFPGQPEIASNGIDDDCDGWADNTGELQPRTCDTSRGFTSAWVLVLVGLSLRRRTR